MIPVAGMQNKEWQIQPKDPQAEELAKKLKVSPILAQILINRNITEAAQARNFLNPKLTDLIPPEKMPGTDAAVIRIKKALEDKEKIVIYGDYDVDGITSVTILFQLFTTLGGIVEYYIPHRIEEGYGLNKDAITTLAQDGANLIITVDCGITANDAIDHAAESGVDIIITDHHQMTDTLPQAVAIVHPNLDDYPNPNSAGAMVAFKLAWAVANQFKIAGKMTEQLRQFLLNATTLAAMGTIADVVDLRGENRILANYGLKALAQSKLLGIKALIDSAGLTGEQNFDSYHIGFRLAPMLNAAGRMGHARLAVELLTSDSEIRSMQIARYLKTQNEQRRQYERKIFKDAWEKITTTGLNHPDRNTIVLADENWHSGVIGIVASRIIDKLFRPTIMLNITDGIAQGSGRSIPGFDMNKALTACSHHLLSYGGHPMAAGLKIDQQNVPAFIEEFEAYAKANITDESLVANLQIDADCTIAELNYHAVKELTLLEPFGSGNTKPIFATHGVKWISPPRKVGARGDHLQIAITDNTASVRCIGFGMGKLEKKLLEADFFSVAYEPQLDTFNGGKNVQFVIKDIRFE